MRDTLARLVQAYGGWSDVAIDAHVYGGGLALALGVGAWLHPGAGAAVFGALLVFLGLWRR